MQLAACTPTLPIPIQWTFFPSCIVTLIKFPSANAPRHKAARCVCVCVCVCVYVHCRQCGALSRFANRTQFQSTMPQSTMTTGHDGLPSVLSAPASSIRLTTCAATLPCSKAGVKMSEPSWKLPAALQPIRQLRTPTLCAQPKQLRATRRANIRAWARHGSRGTAVTHRVAVFDGAKHDVLAGQLRQSVKRKEKLARVCVLACTPKGTQTSRHYAMPQCHGQHALVVFQATRTVVAPPP